MGPPPPHVEHGYHSSAKMAARQALESTNGSAREEGGAKPSPPVMARSPEKMAGYGGFERREG
jgi:hypothetical protein